MNSHIENTSIEHACVDGFTPYNTYPISDMINLNVKDLGFLEVGDVKGHCELKNCNSYIHCNDNQHLAECKNNENKVTYLHIAGEEKSTDRHMIKLECA